MSEREPVRPPTISSNPTIREPKAIEHRAATTARTVRSARAVRHRRSCLLTPVPAAAETVEVLTGVGRLPGC